MLSGLTCFVNFLLSWVYVLLFIIAIAPAQEKLEYEIRYGPIVVGSMVLEHLEPVVIDGEWCEHLRAEVTIDQNFSWFFWAEYRFESWCRSKDWLTLRSYKKTLERNYRSEYYISFVHDSAVARYSDGRVFALPDSARDLLTLWYFLRTINWQENKGLTVNAHIDRRNWNLKFCISGRQMVKTRAGDFFCLAVTPITLSPLGTVFLSMDYRHLPVAIRSKIGGLTVTAFLSKINYKYD